MTLRPLDVEKNLAHEEELNKIVKFEGDHLIITIPDNDFDETYDIPLSNLKTAEHVVSWTFQLTEKNWITRDILRKFIKEASKYAGITL